MAILLFIFNGNPISSKKNVGNYFVFSFCGIRPFSTQSKHHLGKSFSSSVPSSSLIFFLQGPPWEPSVMIEGGEIVENSKAGSTIILWSSDTSTSILKWEWLDWLLKERSLLPTDNGASLTAGTWDPWICLLLLKYWANRLRRVSWARFICEQIFKR